MGVRAVDRASVPSRPQSTQPGPEQRTRRRIRVLLADDHLVTREPLRVWLNEEADIEVVGEAADGEEAVRLTRELRPEILLLDLCIPAIADGLQAARIVVETVPETRIVVLTGYADPECARALVGIGIAGYLDKTTPLDGIVSVLRAVHGGHLCLAPVAAHSVHPSPEPPPEAKLTARELDVLRLLAVGRQNAEIAAELCVCVKTVESHVSSVLQKLGVRSRTEAALKARERGLA